MIVWCLVVVALTVCHQRTCSLHAWNLLIANLFREIFWKIEEAGRYSGRVRGHSSPLEGPWRQLRNQAGALQRSHGGGARGISSWTGCGGVGGGWQRCRCIGVRFELKWQGSCCCEMMGQQLCWNWLHNCQQPAFPLHPPKLSLLPPFFK